MSLKEFFTGGIIDAAKDAFTARTERKEAEAGLEAAITMQKESGAQEIALSEKQWEILQAWKNESTWKDEYVTVSVVSIFNIIVIGALAQAFGFPQILAGIEQAVLTLNTVMVTTNSVTGEPDWTPIGVLISTTIFVALGVYGWKKI